MAVTLTCGFPLWWDLQRGSRAVDGWDWEASCACREEDKKKLAPLGNTMVMIQTASWTPSHAALQAFFQYSIRSGSLATAGAGAVTTAWTGWAGDMDRQLTLNRLDVMHRRPLDSYPQGPDPGPACTSLPVPDHMIVLARRFQHLSSTQKRPPVTGPS